MEIINRYNMVNGKIDQISLFDSEVTRKIRSLGGDPSKDILKISADVPKDFNQVNEEDRVRAELNHCCSEGFMFSEAIYKVMMVTAGGGRKAISDWFNAKFVKELGNWGFCGLRPQDVKLATNKFMAYMGLLMSASKPFEEVFGKVIPANRMAVVGSYDAIVDSIAAVIANTRKIDVAKAKQFVIDAFDGQGIVDADITNKESCTIRAPWIKAFIQAISFKELKQWLKEQGVEPEFKDFWGKTWKLDDVDIILTKSCFKACDLYKSWKQYTDAFTALGHRVCVCVREHGPKLKRMPYQQGQTLLGNREDVEKLAAHAAATLNKYTDKAEATKLLSKWQRKCAEIYPALLNEHHTKRVMQEKYSSKKLTIRSGSVPEFGYNAFLSADIVALVQFIFGMKVTGALKAGEAYCANCEPGLVDLTRNPHLDNAHTLLTAVPSMPLACGNTFYINIFDITTIRIRCDYDGDHGYYSQNKLLLSIVKKTFEKIGCETFDWTAPKAKKVLVTKKEIAEFVSNLLHGSEIGLYAHALTTMWNVMGYDRDICGWLTYGGNVIIDSAKHGQVDKKVMDVLKDILTETQKYSLPEFIMYKKADEEHPVYADIPSWEKNTKYDAGAAVIHAGKTYVALYSHESDDEFSMDAWLEYNGFEYRTNKVLNPYWVAPRISKKGEVKPARVAYSNSFLDQYSRLADDMIPDELVVKGVEEEIFDSYKLLINPHRKLGRIEGLATKPTYYDREIGRWIGGGLFFEIAFRHAEEWKKLINFEAFRTDHEGWEEAKAEEARQEMVAYVRAQYQDVAAVQALSDEKILDAVYDIVCRRIFNIKVSDGLETVTKSAFWRIFGKKAYSILCANLGVDAMEADLTIDDLDDDEDDDDMD